jgi:hypothetical protein
MRRLWSALLLLYPRRYRETFGPEMLNVLAEGSRPPWVEIAGLLKGAAVEWFRPRRSPALAEAPANELAAAEARVNALVERIVYAIAHHEFKTARACCRQETEARERLRMLRERAVRRS